MIQKIRKNRKGCSFKTIFFSVLIGFLLFSIISFLIFSSFRIIKKRSELSSKIENLNEQIQSLKQKKEQLEAGIFQAEGEDYWEEKAREQGYKKPGEQQIVVLLPEEGEIKEKQGKNLWQKFLENFGF